MRRAPSAARGSSRRRPRSEIRGLSTRKRRARANPRLPHPRGLWKSLTAGLKRRPGGKRLTPGPKDRKPPAFANSNGEIRSDERRGAQAEPGRPGAGGSPSSRGAEQRRGRTGAPRRHPRQQRCLLSRLGFPQAHPFLRAAAPQDLRACRRHDPHGQDRHDHHAEDPPAGRRQGRRPDDPAIPRAPRLRSRDDHQRGRLRPGDLRPGAPPLADHHRRGHGQHRL